jgi:hypothetical protein
MKIGLGAIAIVAALAAGLAAVATAGHGTGRPALPPGAVEVAENTYYLGARTVDGVRLEGYAFVHRRSEARKEKPPGGGGGQACYALLASGAMWKASEGFEVDAGSAPASVPQMTKLMNDAVTTWETGADNSGVFGMGTTDNGYDAVLDAIDGVNGAEFAPIADAGVIAVTYTWGQYGGPPKTRSLVEWDMVFDSDSFAWSTNGSSDAMDFLNIATHELGHAFGLGHPSSSCTEETMYAYASYGETKKRDLNAGDIAGINVMY